MHNKLELADPPPEDPEAEAALLGSILMDAPRCMPIAQKYLQQSDFTRSPHRIIYGAMLELWARETAIDYRTVAGLVRGPLKVIGGEQFLAGLIQSTPTVLHAESYAKRVRLFGVAREILGAWAEGAGRVWDAGVTVNDPEELVSRALAPLERLVERRGGGRVFSAEEVAHDYYGALLDRMEGDATKIGLPLGFPELDKLMAYRPGELWYVAGEPGTGKTGFLGSLCDSLGDRGVPSLFVSIEQPLPQLMDRVVAYRASLNTLALAKGKISQDQLTLVGLALEGIAKRPVYYVEHGTLTTAALDAHVQFSASKYGVKVVFVDYVQLLADQVGDSLVEKTAFVSGRLRQIARRYNLCVVAASQLSRAGRLRWAGELEQDPFVILRLTRGANTQRDATTTVHVDKNRNGPAGLEVKIWFDHETAHFTSEAPHREGVEGIPA